MRKKKISILFSILIAVVLGACGNNEETADIVRETTENSSIPVGELDEE